MANSPRKLLVTPLFSLTPLKEMLLPEVVKYEAEINKILSQQQLQYHYPEQNISLMLLPLKFRTDSQIQSNRHTQRNTTIENMVRVYLQEGIFTAPLPYLLGMAATYNDILYRGLLMEAQYVESLSFPDVFAFPGSLGLQQLCLKKSTSGIVVAISEFVQQEFVNATRRIAPASVRVIAMEAPISTLEEHNTARTETLDW